MKQLETTLKTLSANRAKAENEMNRLKSKDPDRAIYYRGLVDGYSSALDAIAKLSPTFASCIKQPK